MLLQQQQQQGTKIINRLLALVLFCIGVLSVSCSEVGCTRKTEQLSITIRDDNVVDLTYPFDENSAYWPTTEKGFQFVNLFKGLIHDPVTFFYSANSFSQPEHLGTHVDAPIHFYKAGIPVNEIKLHDMIAKGFLLDLSQNGIDADSEITIQHFRDLETKLNRRIHAGSIVLIRTGYGDWYHDRNRYYGTHLTGPKSVQHLHFPGLSPDAAEWLVTQRCIAAVGIDTASIDYGQSKEFRSHRMLSKHGIPFFENVANLDKLAVKDEEFHVIALPQKIKDGSGAPVRIVGIISTSENGNHRQSEL